MLHLASSPQRDHRKRYLHVSQRADLGLGIGDARHGVALLGHSRDMAEGLYSGAVRFCAARDAGGPGAWIVDLLHLHRGSGGASGDFCIHCRATFWHEGRLIDWEAWGREIGEEGVRGGHLRG